MVGTLLVAAVLSGCHPQAAEQGRPLAATHRLVVPNEPGPEVPMLRVFQPRPYPVPWQQDGPSVYAWVRVSVAASADTLHHSLTPRIRLEEFDERCPGRKVQQGYSWHWKASVSAEGDAPVIVDSELLCFPISALSPPRSLQGVVFEGRPANLYVMNGEKFLPPDPHAFEGAGASLFLPSSSGGYQIGAFVMAGALEEQVGEAQAFPVVAGGINAVWLSAAHPRMHYLLSADAPDHTQFNVGLTVNVGPAVAGESLESPYEDDSEMFQGEETADAAAFN